MQRSGSRNKKPSVPLTSQAAAKEYREHTESQRALIRRAGVVRERLALASAACTQLFADENFRTLLRAKNDIDFGEAHREDSSTNERGEKGQDRLPAGNSGDSVAQLIALKETTSSVLGCL